MVFNPCDMLHLLRKKTLYILALDNQGVQFIVGARLQFQPVLVKEIESKFTVYVFPVYVFVSYSYLVVPWIHMEKYRFW